MSIESAKAFLERAKTDEKFATRIAACKDAKERSAVLREEGFDFSDSEFREVATVLSDDALAGVFGGSPLPFGFNPNFD